MFEGGLSCWGVFCWSFPACILFCRISDVVMWVLTVSFETSFRVGMFFILFFSRHFWCKFRWSSRRSSDFHSLRVTYWNRIGFTVWNQSRRSCIFSRKSVGAVWFLHSMRRFLGTLSGDDPWRCLLDDCFSCCVTDFWAFSTVILPIYGNF